MTAWRPTAADQATYQAYGQLGMNDVVSVARMFLEHSTEVPRKAELAISVWLEDAYIVYSLFETPAWQTLAASNPAWPQLPADVTSPAQYLMYLANDPAHLDRNGVVNIQARSKGLVEALHILAAITTGVVGGPAFRHDDRRLDFYAMAPPQDQLSAIAANATTRREYLDAAVRGDHTKLELLIRPNLASFDVKSTIPGRCDLSAALNQLQYAPTDFVLLDRTTATSESLALLQTLAHTQRNQILPFYSHHTIEWLYMVLTGIIQV